MKELAQAIYLAVGVFGVIAVVSIYNSPYNQCVRAQQAMNESGKIVVYPFPAALARVQCAEALGGKPD